MESNEKETKQRQHDFSPRVYIFGLNLKTKVEERKKKKNFFYGNKNADKPLSIKLPVISVLFTFVMYVGEKPVSTLRGSIASQHPSFQGLAVVNRCLEF